MARSNVGIVREGMRQIVENIKKTVDEESEKVLRQQAKALAKFVYDTLEVWHPVTGNTYNSIAVGLYYKRKLRYIATSAEIVHKPPTRVTLRKDEAYDLPVYWGGDPVGKEPYRGEYGNINDWSPKIALRLVSSGVAFPDDWVFKVVTGLPYAIYREQVKGANVITEAHDAALYCGAKVSDVKQV